MIRQDLNLWDEVRQNTKNAPELPIGRFLKSKALGGKRGDFGRSPTEFSPESPTSCER